MGEMWAEMLTPYQSSSSRIDFQNSGCLVGRHSLCSLRKCRHALLTEKNNLENESVITKRHDREANTTLTACSQPRDLTEFLSFLSLSFSDLSASRSAQSLIETRTQHKIRL